VENDKSLITQGSYYSFMAPIPTDELVELKVAGRYRLLPRWATKLQFEVRPSPSFDNRAWVLWKPILKLLCKVAKEEKIKIKWVRIHSHFNLKGDIPHAMGWWDHEDKSMFLCHFDKETLLHELGHALSSGYHGDPWAKQTARLFQKYLPKREQRVAMENLAHYLSGRRVFKKIYKESPPKYIEPKSMWLGLKPPRSDARKSK
jgi:hypothetical protein